jgi:UDP-N-acetylmuramyl pentapeptide phosphotransferase/UDP-N-acetylglucosamine-1-phosphate transferase
MARTLRPSKRAIWTSAALLAAHVAVYLVAIGFEAQYDDRNGFLQLAFYLALTWLLPIAAAVILAASSAVNWFDPR